MSQREKNKRVQQRGSQRQIHGGLFGQWKEHRFSVQCDTSDGKVFNRDFNHDCILNSSSHLNSAFSCDFLSQDSCFQIHLRVCEILFNDSLFLFNYFSKISSKIDTQSCGYTIEKQSQILLQN